MTSQERFNNLHNVRHSRYELLSIVEQAKNENNTSVIFRIEHILQKYPNAEYFNLEIEQFPSTGLSAPRHTGSYKEALDECGRLRKGFKFENGSVIKVEPKKKVDAQKGTQPKNKVDKVATKSKKATKTTRRNVPEVKINYNDILIQNNIQQIKKSVEAAIAEGNDEVAINSDRMISLFYDKMKPEHYAKITEKDWSKFEDVLHKYANNLLKEQLSTDKKTPRTGKASNYGIRIKTDNGIYKKKFPLSIVEKDYPIDTKIKVKRNYIPDGGKEGTVIGFKYAYRVVEVEYPFDLIIDFGNGDIQDDIKPWSVTKLKTKTIENEDNNTYNVRKNSKEYKEVLDWKNFTMYDLRTNFEGVEISQGLSDIDKKLAKISKRNNIYTIHIHSNLWYVTDAKMNQRKVTRKGSKTTPVPFSKKPKSSSIKTAVKDILGLPKYKGISEMVASILFMHYKEEPNLLEPKELYLNEFEKAVLKKDSKLHSYYEFQQWHQELQLTSLGEDFIIAVRGRLESLRNQKHNYAMFDGLANPVPEVVVMDSDAQKPAPVLPIFPIQPIQEKKIENWVDAQEPAQEEKPKKLSSGAQRLLGTNFDTLPIDEEWSELMQNPAANLKIAIWGKPKNGKTSASLQMAEYFTNFGKVLYNFADQGFNLSTQELWKDSGLANNENAEPSDISTTQELETEIATGQYKFVFIDMISDYIRKEKLKPEEFKERFIKRFPNVSFILIFEVTKSGDFKGDQGWTHVVDAIMTVENFFMENRGRYGMGERIIWEEGFERYNPKKYEEYTREQRLKEIDTAPSETIKVS